MINKLFLLLAGLFFVSTASAEISSQFEVSNLNFISSDYATEQEKSFVFIGAEIKSENAESDLFKINLEGKFTPSNSVLSYFNLREIYFTNQIDSTAALHIGRKLQTWSVADEKFNLGAYQPQFRWNPLDIESQGLFGIFYDKSFGSWKLNLFGTPVYIPDQGPAYEVKDGKFEASNPYFAPPPQNIIFQNIVLPIDYNIIKPEVSEVVQQAGFGFKLDYQNKNFEASLAGSYKPSNQFAFGYKGILVTNRVRVDIQPKTPIAKEFEISLRCGELELNLVERTVMRAGKQIEVHPTEFRLLEYLMRHAGKIVTRTMLLENVWHFHFDPKTNVVETHISRLRSKVDRDFDHEIIKTIRGAGYKIDA